MENDKADRLSIYSIVKHKLSDYSHSQIENGVVYYCLTEYNCDSSKYYSQESAKIASLLRDAGLTADLGTVIEFFESLLEKDNKDENGMVFTPQYIAEYIALNLFENLTEYDEHLSIVDPGCGCGIFLIAAAELVSSKFNVSMDVVITNNIFGIDIDGDNVRRCKLILRLLSAKHGGNYESIEPKIICRDSLKCSWTEEFHVSVFNYVIGNPPYVNPHDMNKETVRYLKKTFATTKSGVFNIFYAFIEYAIKFLDENGFLGYIVPNNFLTIKSACELRKFLQEYKLPKRILDFGDNMIFKPVRTYNCIIILSKHDSDEFEYCTMEKTADIKAKLDSLSYYKMTYESLDKNGWKLVDEVTFRNLRKIESQMVSIKGFIRTGIATLRDGAYLADCDNAGYYKLIGNKKIYIESGLVKPIYKVPDLKLHDNIEDAKRYIIFPYVKNEYGYTLIDEALFKSKYPQTYLCLSLQRDELESRNKGNGNPQGWYAYGRTQGLNKYGKKLLFPTFSNRPKFIYVSNEDALFCNGYAVFENDRYDLDILQRVLNSRLMNYYISNTSYSIEGGYYCYQKKYVERFSLPWFTESDVQYIRNAPTEDLDDFLWQYYNLE